LWLEKRQAKQPDDLSGKLPVVLGSWTEQFNRQWYEKLSGNLVTRIGEVATCPEHPWRRCTLDGFLETDAAIWEAKHTSGFVTVDHVLERYMPQLQHSMAVVGVSKAVLSVIFGNQKFEILEIASDWLYQQELLEAERHFWDCVQTGKEPVVIDPPPAPRPIGTREVNFEGNNAWASAAVDWLDNREATKTHAVATGLVKALIEDDVVRAFGHGIEARRSKSGAITIRELA
jgi:predicted phage-related endonuclease